MGLSRGPKTEEVEPEPAAPAVDAAAQKLHDWRLLNLIDAYEKEPVEMEDVELLGLIARANSDLHDVCRALKRGCSLEHAVIIFT